MPSNDFVFHKPPFRIQLVDIAARRARQGFTGVETATFVVSLKQPIFEQLREALVDLVEPATVIWATTVLFDDFGLVAMEAHSHSRDQTISTAPKSHLPGFTLLLRIPSRKLDRRIQCGNGNENAR
ncbi:RsbRD N-terminal domain-containing protein [Pararobbsia alpina]|uniref:RsbRD N-terminal domain-containing protein n=1 Tax=Pararobbsia alpina TaxID=621374 RepID=UPI0039A697CC